MQPQETNYKQLLSEVIKKQIIILGPTITLAKVKNVAGITVTDDGTVIEITGNPQEVTQLLIDQFMELSELIVKKTMEPLLQRQTEAISATPDVTTCIPSPTLEATQVLPPTDSLQTQIDQAAQQITSPNPIIEPVHQEEQSTQQIANQQPQIPPTEPTQQQQELSVLQPVLQPEQVPSIQIQPEAAVSSTSTPMIQFASAPSTIPQTSDAPTNPSQPQQIQEKQQS